MAQLSHHPSIVTIYHAAIAADGRPFLVMEYCSRPGPGGAVPAGAHLRRGGAADRHPAGVGGRDRAPRRDPAPGHQARERADHRLRVAGAHGLRHRRDDGPRTRVRRSACRSRGRRPSCWASTRRATSARTSTRWRRRSTRCSPGGPRSRSPAGRTPRSSWSPGSSGRRCRPRVATTCPRACRSCSSAPWRSTRRAGSPPRPRSRVRSSRSRPTCGCRSPRSTSWTRPDADPAPEAPSAPSLRTTATRTRPGCARSSPWPPRPPSRPDRPRHAAGADEATRLRGVTYVAPEPAHARPGPVFVAPAEVAEPEAEAVPRGRSRMVAGVVSGLVVLAAVVAIGAAVLRDGRRDRRPDARRRTSPRTPCPTAVADAVPSPSGLQGTRQADGSVVFTWDNPEPQTGDRYVWGVLAGHGRTRARARSTRRW